MMASLEIVRIFIVAILIAEVLFSFGMRVLQRCFSNSFDLKCCVMG